MKVVLLAGGLGTRLAEETSIRPKPMVEIGGRPIIWHIMKIYLAHGIDEVIICCGYKGNYIKEYFANYALQTSDMSIDFRSGTTEYLSRRTEPWKVTLVDTGESTMTGGRLKRVRHLLGDEDFCFTYGDGVSNVDITALLRFHKEQAVLCTLTAVKPPGRFGALSLPGTASRVGAFAEKLDGQGAWVNGGFFVVNPKAIDLIADDATSWEKEPLEQLAASRNLAAFRHEGFWQPMDSLRDKLVLEDLWQSNRAPWRVW
jgi:glucose-1-phosphate cytidylyltransferase